MLEKGNHEFQKGWDVFKIHTNNKFSSNLIVITLGKLTLTVNTLEDLQIEGRGPSLPMVQVVTLSQLLSGCRSVCRCAWWWDQSARKHSYQKWSAALASAVRQLQSFVWPWGYQHQRACGGRGKLTGVHCSEAAGKIIDCGFWNIYSSPWVFLKV